MQNSRVLIVDDDQCACEILGDLVSSWGMNPESLTNPILAVTRTAETEYDIALLDVFMPGLNGLDLLQHIRDHSPATKAIVMTGRADTQTAVKALQSGAFDFLEKPVEPDLLHHTFRRALDAKDKERELDLLLEELTLKQSQLVSQNERLEFLNNQLLETNKALSILAQNIEREQEGVTKAVALRLRSVVFPCVDKLRRDKNLAGYEYEFSTLIKQIEDMTSGMTTDARIASALSYTELRIASLIKNGLTTEDIATQLHISDSTVRTHRKNIRRKLKINNAAYSLKNFLVAKLDHAHKI